MNILVGVHHFPPRYTGGAEWRAHRTARALRARGHRVQVVCVEHIDRGPSTGITWEDEVFDDVPVRRLAFNMDMAPDAVRWEYDNQWIGEHLRGWFAEEPIDVFHLIGGYMMSGAALTAAQESSIPTVVTLTDFWFLCRRISMLRSDGRVSLLPIDPIRCAQCLGEERRRYRWLSRIAPALMRIYWRSQKKAIYSTKRRLQFLRGALNDTSAVISPSLFLRSIYEEAGVMSERIVFMRQGLDLLHLDPVFIANTPSRQLRVGYIGQIAELKGVHVLVEAARQVQDARLSVCIYGDDARFPGYTARLRRLIGGDLRIHLAGAYRGAQALSEVMRNLDVIAVPSLWYENSPNVILEAFAHRVPVVATHLGGMAELVQHDQNGLLFELGNAEDLANQLRRLLQDRSLLPRLVAGIGPVKTVEQEMDEIEAVYEQVMLRRKAASSA